MLRKIQQFGIVVPQREQWYIHQRQHLQRTSAATTHREDEEDAQWRSSPINLPVLVFSLLELLPVAIVTLRLPLGFFLDSSMLGWQVFSKWIGQKQIRNHVQLLCGFLIIQRTNVKFRKPSSTLLLTVGCLSLRRCQICCYYEEFRECSNDRQTPKARKSFLAEKDLESKFLKQLPCQTGLRKFLNPVNGC